MVFSDQEFHEMGKRVEMAEQEAESRKKDALRYKWELDQLQSNYNEKVKLLAEKEGRVSALTQVLCTKSEEINLVKLQNSELKAKLEKTQEQLNIVQANMRVTEAQFHNEQEKYYALEKRLSDLMTQSNPLSQSPHQHSSHKDTPAQSGAKELLKAVGAPEVIIQQSAKCADEAVEALRKLNQDLQEDSEDKMRFKLTLSQVLNKAAQDFETLHFSVQPSTYLPAVHDAIFCLVEDCPIIKQMKLEHSTPQTLLRKFSEETSKGNLILKGTKKQKDESPRADVDPKGSPQPEPMSPGAIDGFMDALLNDKPTPKKTPPPQQTASRGPGSVPQGGQGMQNRPPMGSQGAPPPGGQQAMPYQQYPRGPPYTNQYGVTPQQMNQVQPVTQQLQHPGAQMNPQMGQINPSIMNNPQQRMIPQQYSSAQQQMMVPQQSVPANGIPGQQVNRQMPQQVINPQQQMMINPQQQQQMMNPQQQQQMMNPQQQQQMMNPQMMNPQQQMMNTQQPQMMNQQQQQQAPQMVNPQMMNSQQMAPQQQQQTMVNPQMAQQMMVPQNPQIINQQVTPQQMSGGQYATPIQYPQQSYIAPQQAQQYSTPQVQAQGYGMAQQAGAGFPQGNIYNQTQTYR